MPVRFSWLYLGLWSAACLVALALYLRRPRAMAPSGAAYWRFLARPWKLVTFAVSGAGLVLLAPYTGDPTWDWVDAGFMSVLAFATAPWTVAAVARGIRGQAAGQEVFVAVCVALFSASWSYDLYLLWRDGYYPVTWLENLLMSGLLYLCAGLFWNLDWTPGRGLGFAFTAEPWPPLGAGAGFRRIVWPAAVLMAAVGVMTLALVWFGLPR